MSSINEYAELNFISPLSINRMVSFKRLISFKDAIDLNITVILQNCNKKYWDQSRNLQSTSSRHAGKNYPLYLKSSRYFAKRSSGLYLEVSTVSSEHVRFLLGMALYYSYGSAARPLKRILKGFAAFCWHCQLEIYRFVCWTLIVVFLQALIRSAWSLSYSL